MVPNINALTPGNSVLALIDHQPYVAFPIESHPRADIINNVVGLAKSAQAIGVPVVLTTISAKGGPLVDPLFTQLSEVFPDVEPIDRQTTNAWSDPPFVEAVRATGRPKLVVAGLWTEVCLAQTVLSARRDGVEVYFVGDASGGLSREAHDDAKARMTAAGAVPQSWLSVVSEWVPDNADPLFQALLAPTAENGGALAPNVQYLLAQLAAGTVAPPPGPVSA